MAADLLGLAEIAALLGTTKQVVSNWRTRKPGFPHPVVELKSGPVWQREDIVRWAKREGVSFAEPVEGHVRRRAPARHARIVALMNMKGGVGKSTLATNLGWYAAFERNRRVLLVDLDPQFNLSQYVLGTAGYEKLLHDEQLTVEALFRPAEERPENVQDVIVTVREYRDGSCVHLIPASLDLAWTIKHAESRVHLLKTYLDEVRNMYDLIIIDCAPTESLLSIAAYHAADYVFIPVKPEFLPTIGLPLLQRSMLEFGNTYRDASVPEVGGIILNDTANKVEQEKSRHDILVAAKEYDWPILKNEISHSESYPAGARLGKPIFMTDNARTVKKSELVRLGDEFLKGIGL
ncbi:MULTISPECIES: ParA family protein [unclassified Bradyrhizobium]|uniref:ParA family protein n=1 Tax=unclassified Bradyrhizobium TaxID=2631580 RepID=UPI0028E5D507|nr:MULTISPECIES: ParA family protein [unclassified Bradyrhizobium]